MAIVEPDVYRTATLVNGLPTVTFSPKTYRRVITAVTINSIVASAASISRGGQVNAATITSIPFANPNTYTAPFQLPAGQLLFVVFSNVAAPVDPANPAAFARISALRED